MEGTMKAEELGEGGESLNSSSEFRNMPSTIIVKMSSSAGSTELPRGNQSDSFDHAGKNLGDNSGILGFGLLTILLLVLCALLTGLTLAICGLDITRLQIFCVTGDQRQRNQALVTLRIKRHMSWFLCSMIICSVACAESIPVIIGSLYKSGVVPIVVSTVAVAVFAELLPQFIIPRYPIVWAYYCWPLIWSCMWATCIISWPLSYLLEAISGPQSDKSILTAEQLGIFIAFHERAEKHGGLLGPDTSRIMRGALKLDNRTLLGECQSEPGKDKTPSKDIERGETTDSGILVPWSSVRCIRINEEVTKEFVTRIKNWAYSRVPVIDDWEVRDQWPVGCCEDWNNQRVYGFLHVKNLIDLDLSDQDSRSKRLFVKDLPLYPLPIVRNDLPLYDLLNVFQLGMARMAVVVPRPPKDQLVPLSASIWNQDALPRHVAPLWSASTGLNSRNIIEILSLDAQIDWTTDFLDAAQNDVKPTQQRKHSVIGIGCPKPIGIVTYEDIIDALLQKTSLDEKDFYERDRTMPPTKQKKEGDTNSVSSNHSTVRSKKAVPLYVAKVHAAFERRSEGQDNALRRRVMSRPKNRPSENDGDVPPQHGMTELNAGTTFNVEQGGQGFDGANDRDVTGCKRVVNDCSSYTMNSQGGFHGSMTGAELTNAHQVPSSEMVMERGYFPMDLAYAKPGHVTMQMERAFESFSNPSNRNCSTITNLPRLRRATSFSLPASQIDLVSQTFIGQDKSSLLNRPATVTQDHRSLNSFDSEVSSTTALKGAFNYFRESPASATSLSPVDKFGPFQIENFPWSIDNQEPRHIITSNDLTLADDRQIDICTKTLEKPSSSIDHAGDAEMESLWKEDFRLRHEGVHDDRALLPSQLRRRDRKSQFRGRRISLWF